MSKKYFTKLIIFALVVCLLAGCFVCCKNGKNQNTEPPLGGEDAGDPQQPDIPDTPDNPDNPDNPDTPNPPDPSTPQPPNPDDKDTITTPDTVATKTTMMLPLQNKTIDDYTPLQNLYLTCGVLQAAGSFNCETTGNSVAMSIKQGVHTVRTVLQDAVFKQSVSYSTFVKLGTQTLTKGSDYIVREAKKVRSLSNVVWNDSASKLTASQFTAKYGTVSNGLSMYVLNDLSVKTSAYIGKDGENYVFEYQLDNDYSVQYLKYESRTQAGCDKFPEFSYIKITLTIDKDWIVKSLQSYAKYKADKLGGVNCEETLTDVYTNVGTVTALPNMDFFSKYLTV